MRKKNAEKMWKRRDEYTVIVDDEKPYYSAEIFCKKKYKDYYIRGRILEIRNKIYSKYAERLFAYYRFKILVLINDLYPVDPSHALVKRMSGKERGLRFTAKTKDEFLKILREMEIYPWDGIASKQISFKSSISDINFIFITVKEIRRFENAYLKEQLGAKANIILVNMTLDCDRIESKTDKSVDSFKNIYPLVVYNFVMSESVQENLGWFERLYKNLHSCFGNIHLEEKEYYSILYKIGKLGYRWIRTKKITDEYLKLLNKFIKGMGKYNREYPLIDFCYRFFDNLVDDLMAKTNTIKCINCGMLAKYSRKTKKYCSPVCGHRYASKKDYYKYKSKRLKTKRAWIQKTRQEIPDY